MKRIFLLLLIIGLNAFALEVTLNTQLDQKLNTLSKRSSKKPTFQLNILRQVEIKGLKHIDESLIRNVLSVFKGDELGIHVINRNIKRIESLGYFESVSSKTVNFEGGKKWIITVKENPVITKIQFTGNTTVPSQNLKEVIVSKIGDVFNQPNLRKDIENIEKDYEDKGYLRTRVKGVDLPTYKQPILIFNIEESTINEIAVSGNTKTKDYVILREIDIKPGDELNQKELRKNLSRVFNLNYFSEVIPDIMPSDSTANAYNLLINVTEKSTDSVNFGGGWGQQSGGFLYSDLNINNFLGTGQLVALRGQWGSNLQTYQFKYHNPWMFGKRKSLTYRAWNTQGSFGFNNFGSGSTLRPEKRYGMDVAVGLPHSYEVRSTHRIKTEDVRVDETDDSDGFNYSIQSYAYSLSYDTRDIVFNPLNGFHYVVTIENSFKLKSNSLIYTKYDATLSNFFQTREKQTIATRLKVGRINGALQSTEYYFVGGPNTVRGYEEYPNSFAFGKSQWVANIEYRFLLSDVFQFLFFVDAGWASSTEDVFDAKVGKGFGFRINSPLGPIRIDFGIDEEGDMRTHLNIGHIF